MWKTVANDMTFQMKGVRHLVRRVVKKYKNWRKELSVEGKKQLTVNL